MRYVGSLWIVLGMLSPCLGAKGLQFELDGKKQSMLPLGYTTDSVLGLRRNGSMLEVEPDEIENPRVLTRFKPFSQAEMRGELLREFGRAFEVTGTGNYLVVHPKGSRDLWAGRFEELYRSVAHFFRSRGLPMEKPQFPLVGIVFYSKPQYEAYMQQALRTDAMNTWGMYKLNTNRIYLFDATQGAGTQSRQWQENLATIMHEAAHQTAFNTGIHRRGAITPAWLVEGLGCLFEAKGIYDAQHYRNREDRINLGRLLDFRKHVAELGDFEYFISSLVTSDRWFRTDAPRAYAAAWALTFYLSERQPRDYIRYIQTVASRESMQDYTRAERARDFAKFFGTDHRMLAVRVKRFISGIHVPTR